MPLARLNPFRALPNPRQVFAWGMYDLANQSFTLLITTLYFAIYFDQFIAESPQQGEQWRNWSFAAASLIVVVISPFFGISAPRSWEHLHANPEQAADMAARMAPNASCPSTTAPSSWTTNHSMNL
jgi:hypothetical protein